MKNKIHKSVWVVLALLPLLLPLHLTAENANDRQTNEETAQRAVLPVPTPLELKNNWWGYFSVKGKEELKERIDNFLKSLDHLKKSLDKEEQQAVIHTINHLAFNFETYNKKKNGNYSYPLTSVQFLKKYSVDQLLKVHTNLLRVNRKIETLSESLLSKKNQLSYIRTQLDELFLDYQNEPPSSYNRLSKGIDIIERRLIFEITELDISHIQERIAFYSKEKSNLTSELNLAKENLTFEKISKESLNQEWQDLSASYENSKGDLYELQKKASYEKKVKSTNKLNVIYWDYRVFVQSIFGELLKVKVLSKEIQSNIFLIAADNQSPSTSSLQALIKQWKKQVTDANTMIMHWEQKLQNEQASIGRVVSQILANDDIEGLPEETLLADIHLQADKALSYIQDLKVELKNSELLYGLLDWYLIKEKKITETWSIILSSYYHKSVQSLMDIGNITLVRNQNVPITISSLIRSLLIVIFAVLMSFFIRKHILQKSYLGKTISKSTEYIVSRTLHYLFIVFGVIIALSYIGLDFTNFVIIASALGVGIGFGLQSMVNNILSGFSLLFQRNVKVGDIVELDSTTIGRVMAINLQNTHIKSFDGVDLIVPNGQLTSQLLNNWTMRDSCRRFKIPFKVAYGEDKEKVRDIAIGAANQLPCTKRGDFRYPDPQVWFIGFGENWLELELVVWVDLAVVLQHGTAKSMLFWELETALRKNDISFPIPERKVTIKDYPKEKLSAMKAQLDAEGKFEGEIDNSNTQADRFLAKSLKKSIEPES